MGRFHSGFLLTCLIALGGGLTGGQARVDAQATPTAAAPAFVIEPVGQDGTYLVLEASAGSETTLTVALGNAGDADVPARTYAADAFSLVNGGFGVRAEAEPTTGTTTWLGYEAETLDLVAGKQIERSFAVTIPAETTPGQYITGLVLQTAEPIAVGDSAMLRQNIVKAIAVVITVPGPIEPSLTNGAASLKQTTVSNSLVVEVANTGNILLKPAGTVTMTTTAGEPVLTAPVAMGPVYAGTTTSVELPVPTIVPAGNYRVTVVLTDAETGAAANAADLRLAVAEQGVAAAAAISPVTIEGIILDPAREPATDALQFVNVTVELNNTGAPIPNARLTLHVTRDGELVEDFPLNAALVIANGATEVQQRYLPATGWASGTYTFAVTLEAVDANSGQITVWRPSWRR